MTWGPSEKDTCRDVILPALGRVGWATPMIVSEYPVRGKADHVDGRGAASPTGWPSRLCPRDSAWIARCSRGGQARLSSRLDGVQQSVRYAEQLDVPIAYSSNGQSIIERDMTSGTQREVESFMTPAEAWGRYVEHHGLDDEGAELLLPHFNREKRSATGDVVEPRWYQRVAVHSVLAAMARGERRVLVLMATGTGKTFTAMQIVHKLRVHDTTG